MRRMILLVGALFGVTAALRAQSIELPSAPAPATAAPALKLEAPASKPLFTLPADQPQRPTGAAPRKEEEFCFAKAEGLFASKYRQIPPDVRGPFRNYYNTMFSRIFADWSRNMTLAEKNAWGKGRKVAIRFVVHPDGTYDEPEMTVSSGRDRYDEHAMQAIRSNAEFPPLPIGINHPVSLCVIVGFHLDVDRGDGTGWIDQLNKQP
jgi:TonB family protein